MRCRCTPVIAPVARGRDLVGEVLTWRPRRRAMDRHRGGGAADHRHGRRRLPQPGAVAAALLDERALPRRVQLRRRRLLQPGERGRRRVRPPGTRPLGEACGAPGDCSSGHCADGVCCDSDCSDACRACNLPDNRGTCVAVARGQQPAHASCATQPAATCGTNGLCDGAGGCQFHNAGTICGDAACDPASNSLTPERRCDGNGACAAATGGALSCAPFMCNAARTGCADHCSRDGDVAACVLPNVCSGGSCGKVGNGIPCRAATSASRGSASTACAATPLARAVHGLRRRGAVGTCSQVPAGSPRGSRPACAGAGTIAADSAPPPARPHAPIPPPRRRVAARAARTARPARPRRRRRAATGGGCGAGVASGCGVYSAARRAAAPPSCAGDFDCVAGYICQNGACAARGTTAAPCTTPASARRA